MAEPGRIAAAADGRYELEIRRRYPQPIDEVWDALTQPERLARWLAPVRYEPKVGSPITVDFGGDEVVRGEVVEFSPPRVFAFTWTERPDRDDASVVRFALRSEAGATVLELTHAKQPGTMAAGTAGGWHAHLDLFDGLLRGQPLEWDDVYPQAKALYASAVEGLR